MNPYIKLQNRKLARLQAAKLAGEHYNLRCPIAAEAKIGKTWADVH